VLPSPPDLTLHRAPLRAGQAYSYLKEALLSGEYKAGQRLPVDAIASRIGASRQPVMDAIRRLAGEGLVTVIPQVGTIVTKVAPEQVVDFFGFLAEAEGRFCELAADRATAAEVQALNSEIDRFEAGQGESDPHEAARQYRLHNRAFHGLIHQMARSPLFHQTVVMLWDKADFYINSLTRGEPFVARQDEAVAEHREIARALSARDGKDARRQVVRHINAFARVIATDTA
jgi:DNA-binding GntR family transcriptional regulator